MAYIQIVIFLLSGISADDKPKTNGLIGKEYDDDFEIIDLLEKAIDKDIEYDKTLLLNEGVLTGAGEIVKNKLNLMTRAYATNLIFTIEEADMSVQEVIEHVESLYQENQLMGVFYLLLYLFTGLEIEIPYLYMQLPSRETVLRFYIEGKCTDQCKGLPKNASSGR